MDIDKRDQAAAAMPDNAKGSAAGAARSEAVAAPNCCAPSKQASCCEPSAKASCCGAAPAGSCGCR
jgi:arsenite methyltransferase